MDRILHTTPPEAKPARTTCAGSPVPFGPGRIRWRPAAPTREGAGAERQYCWLSKSTCDGSQSVKYEKPESAGGWGSDLLPCRAGTSSDCEPTAQRDNGRSTRSGRREQNFPGLVADADRSASLARCIPALAGSAPIGADPMPSLGVSCSGDLKARGRERTTHGCPVVCGHT